MLVLTTTTTLVQSRNEGDALVNMRIYPNYCSISMRKRGFKFKLETAMLFFNLVNLSFDWLQRSNRRRDRERARTCKRITGPLVVRLLTNT